MAMSRSTPPAMRKSEPERPIRAGIEVDSDTSDDAHRDDVATGATTQGQYVARALHRPGMKDQLVEILGILVHGRRPQAWISVNVVPHVTGSTSSRSASWRSAARSSRLSVSSS